MAFKETALIRERTDTQGGVGLVYSDEIERLVFDRPQVPNVENDVQKLCDELKAPGLLSPKGYTLATIEDQQRFLTNCRRI